MAASARPAGKKSTGTSGAGYSGTPLPKKLGMKEGMQVLLVGAPKGFSDELGDVPAGVTFLKSTKPGKASRNVGVAVVFCKEARTIFDAFMEAAKVLEEAGGLWIAWPKKTSPLKSDITENLLREVLLPTGYVDNKVCAIDDDWSGLRFVKRKELRKNG